MGTPDGMGYIAVFCILIGFAVELTGGVFLCRNGKKLWKEGRTFFALLDIAAGFSLLVTGVIGLIVILSTWYGQT